jgi:hypothetical protein
MLLVLRGYATHDGTKLKERGLAPEADLNKTKTNLA